MIKNHCEKDGFKRRKLKHSNEEDYDYIYYDFLSSLVNNESYNPIETMIDSKEFYTGMELFIRHEEGNNNSGVVGELASSSLGKGLQSFKNGFNKGIFQRTLNRIIFESSANSRSIMHKVSKKTGLSYKVNYEELKRFLVEAGHYNDKYELLSLKLGLPTYLKASSSLLALSSYTCKDEIYKRYLNTYCLIAASSSINTKQIYGIELFQGMKDFVKAKLLDGIEDENVREMYERYEKGINVTRFGKDLNEILLFGQNCCADKVFTNKGTRYTLHLRELGQFCRT